MCRTEPTSAGQKFSKGRSLELFESGSADNVSTCKPLRFPWSQDMIDMMAIYRLSQTLQLRRQMSSKLPCQSKWLKVLFHVSLHPEGNKPHHLPHHRAGVSTGGRLGLLLPKSAGIAKEIAMAWRDACENYNIYIWLYMQAIWHHSWCTWG